MTDTTNLNEQNRAPKRSTRTLVRNLPCTLELSELSVLPPLEEDTYKLEVARRIRVSKEAEVELVRSLLAEARAAVTRRQAEIKLAIVREDEAQSRVEYYLRMDQEVANHLVNAELQIGVIHHRLWGNSEKEVLKEMEGAPALFSRDESHQSLDETHEAATTSISPGPTV
ncbi:hypothetical protein B0H19DRAFT_1085059 [Mycena capillaripes]|nr:hypothetical protein B0H19DRAFT_1085059 [Mycena capillaripes]